MNVLSSIKFSLRFLSLCSCPSPSRLLTHFVSGGKRLREPEKEKESKECQRVDESSETVIDSLFIFVVNAESNKSVYKWWTWAEFTPVREDTCVCREMRGAFTSSRWSVTLLKNSGNKQWKHRVSSMIHNCSMIRRQVLTCIFDSKQGHLHHVLSLNVHSYLPTRGIQGPSEILRSASLATSCALLWI